MNGKNIIMMMGDKPIAISKGITIPMDIESKESPGWKELMKNTKYWSCEISNKKEAVMIYYCHRGKRYFFKNKRAKIVIECNKFPLKLKYGTKVDMEFTTEKP